MNEFIELLMNTVKEEKFISCVLSNPRLKLNSYSKITGKLIELKNTLYMQFSMLKDNKEYHENVLIKNLPEFLKSIDYFRQIQLYASDTDSHILISKSGVALIRQSSATKAKAKDAAHDRKKNYILDDEASKLFLKDLGLMDNDGTIKPSRYDKYKQINKYLEFIEDVIPLFEDKNQIRIVDFGCGKSYLTFALYHYFKVILNKNVEIIGLDLKEDVISFCNALSARLNFRDLHFQVGDIGNYTTDKEIDIVVSLHACNTATDAALAKAIQWQTKVIFAVPCCHHELYGQLKNDELKSILKYGILKERIAALLTDGLRANLLECYGYKVNVMEFIDMEHTPKNILIRAVRNENARFDNAKYQNYLKLCTVLNADLSLPRDLDLK